MEGKLIFFLDFGKGEKKIHQRKQFSLNFCLELIKDEKNNF